MGLTSVVDAIAAHLAASLPPPAPAVGPAQPATGADLPAVAISVTRAEQPLPALGRTPASVMTGALRVETSIDLADPVLHLPGEDVSLLSPDRRVVHLPHGSVVRADGIGEHPFGAGDLLVRVGATTFPPVAGVPSAAQVQLDPQAGILRFLDPLPAGGNLELGYFIGAWEVRTERHQGEVEVEVFAAVGGSRRRSVGGGRRRPHPRSHPRRHRVAPDRTSRVGAGHRPRSRPRPGRHHPHPGAALPVLLRAHRSRHPDVGGTDRPGRGGRAPPTPRPPRLSPKPSPSPSSARTRRDCPMRRDCP